MDETQARSGDISDWVVQTGAPRFPTDVVAAATASQASLAEKLVALRSLSQPFPSTGGSAAGDRWVERT